MKKAIIISFIDGKKINLPNSNECFEVGKMIGELHKLTINFNLKRKNSLDIVELKNITYIHTLKFPRGSRNQICFRDFLRSLGFFRCFFAINQ